MTQASVSEFNAEMSKMPATRKSITAVGPYILELYERGILDVGDEDRAAIEINKKRSDGSYSKEDSLKFDTEEAATTVYNDIKNSQSKVESRL